MSDIRLTGCRVVGPKGTRKGRFWAKACGDRDLCGVLIFLMVLVFYVQGVGV